MQLVEEGLKHRTTAQTKMNESSSRSHAVFQVVRSLVSNLYWMLPILKIKFEYFYTIKSTKLTTSYKL